MAERLRTKFISVRHACGIWDAARGVVGSLEKHTTMRPSLSVDPRDLRANAVAWDRSARLPVRAVVKANGYGWGVDTLVDALDATVEGYYVSDADEFSTIRSLTTKPVATLGDVSPSELPSLLANGGIPTISTQAGIAAAAAWMRAHGKPARIRVALRNATGWSGIFPDEVRAIVSALERTDLRVEISSHITDASLAAEQIDEFRRARTAMLDADIAIVASDIASTAPSAAGMHGDCSHVRIGVGLFGARFGADVGVVSALRVRAPIVDREPARGQRTGYGLHRAPNDGYLAVLRCGYGDGFPVVRDERFGILAVGMQFTTVHSPTALPGDDVALIHRNTDLDALSQAAGIAPHRLVTALGNAARAAR